MMTLAGVKDFFSDRIMGLDTWIYILAEAS